VAGGSRASGRGVWARAGRSSAGGEARDGGAGRRRLCLPADGDDLLVRPWEMPTQATEIEGETGAAADGDDGA
jgi:hypothetical protein